MPTIKKPNQYFDATLYTGNGGTQSVTNAGGFQPDFVWIKDRSNGTNYHALFDVIRGTNNRLFSNATDAQNTTTGTLTAFNSNGFTLGSQEGQNANGNSLVAWQWKAGGASTVNTSGSISSNVSVNTTAGFSVVTYTGTGANATVGHGLGVAPAMMIVKGRNTTTGQSWRVYHKNANASPASGVLNLNVTDAFFTSSTQWNNTDPTSTVLSIGTDPALNENTKNYVAYCWAEVEGYSKFGSYTGNGSADGSFIFTNFAPKFVIIKRSDSGNSWFMIDTVRQTYNVIGPYLTAEGSGAEATGTSWIDVLSNGFKLRSSLDAWNANGGTYIFMAFAEAPFKFSNAR